MIRRRSHGEEGFTIAEMITVVAIIGVLASLALPVAKFTLQRQKEVELRDRLRTITRAIDRYHDLRVKQMINEIEVHGADGWPKELEALVEPIELKDGTSVKLLRERDLIDPMTGKTEWMTRSTTDERDSNFTDGNNVFDVHSTSERTSLDGRTKYSEW